MNLPTSSGVAKKLFTPQKANQALPLVKGIVEDILNAGQEIRALASQIGPNAEKDPEVMRIMAQLEGYFDEIESIGCSYRDWNFSMGLVDFPAVIDKKEVFLCWRSDEAELKFYHDPETGFAGRKPIPGEYLAS